MATRACIGVIYGLATAIPADGGALPQSYGGVVLAFQLPAWQQPPELREVSVPEPRAGEVRRGEIAGRAVVCPHG